MLHENSWHDKHFPASATITSLHEKSNSVFETGCLHFGDHDFADDDFADDDAADEDVATVDEDLLHHHRHMTMMIKQFFIEVYKP